MMTSCPKCGYAVNQDSFCANCGLHRYDFYNYIDQENRRRRRIALGSYADILIADYERRKRGY